MRRIVRAALGDSMFLRRRSLTRGARAPQVRRSEHQGGPVHPRAEGSEGAATDEANTIGWLLRERGGR